MHRACPVCLRPLSWRYPRGQHHDLPNGHAWCRAHGRLRRWYVMTPDGRCMAVASGTREVRGRLLQEPVRPRPRSWNATTMKRYAPRFR
jgi:hypothetical protein